MPGHGFSRLDVSFAMIEDAGKGVILVELQCVLLYLELF